MDQTIEVSAIARLVSVARTSSSAAINDETFIPILKALLALHTRLRDLVEAQLTVPSILVRIPGVSDPRGGGGE